MRINYQHPSFKEYKYFDAKWFCPILFKNLSLDGFLKALFGVMLEKTIVFTAEDVQTSSCAVLAMKALVEPFKICFAIIPVMPKSVLEYLSAPVPLLVGLPTQLLRNNNIDYFDKNADLNEEMNWVNLDDENYSLWNCDDFTIPHLADLKSAIKQDYDFIHNINKNLVEYQDEEVDRRVKNIVDLIRNSIFEHFVIPIPCSMDYADFDNNQKFNKEMPSPRSMVPTSSVELKDFKFKDNRDKDFFSEFYFSLMFQTFLEEYTKKE